MSEYRRVMLRGQPRYMFNGKFVKKDSVPEATLIRLRVEERVEIEQPIVEKTCLFCELGGCKFTKFINSQTIYLCDEHYYSETTGKIAQRLRERETVHA